MRFGDIKSLLNETIKNISVFFSVFVSIHTCNCLRPSQWNYVYFWIMLCSVSNNFYDYSIYISMSFTVNVIL